MIFFLRRICPVVAVLVFIGGVWLWVGGTYFEADSKLKSVIVLSPNPTSLFMNIFGLYFFLKCTFCSLVLFILSHWLAIKLEADEK